MERENSLQSSIVSKSRSGCGRLHRRTLLKLGMLGLTSASMAGIIESMVWHPKRAAHAAPGDLPDIQFDVQDYIAPAQTFEGIQLRFGPVFTLYMTARLTRMPDQDDQQLLADALDAIEAAYPFSPDGVFTCVAYGLPYFGRLPDALVTAYMPRLLSDPARFALEEAMPGPTDVSEQNPQIRKKTFHIPVTIEQNDLLITLRSDSLRNIMDVAYWLRGEQELRGAAAQSVRFGDLLEITSMRLMFVQMGLPRKIADHAALPYASSIHPQSSMWMGFIDQHVNASGPAGITTFQGNTSARFTTLREGDYFYNGSIQHLSHLIEDLTQFYDTAKEPYSERVQYMFRSHNVPIKGYAHHGGQGDGPACVDNIYYGADDALRNAIGIGTYDKEHRMGHLTALQQSSRAGDGTAIHIRADGPGFDNLDVPDGSNQPKLHFSIFAPTADFFATLRKNQAALHLCQKYHVEDEDNGLERFITATRRQNFLVPPRARRAFPLLELT
jgi:hypothetical protein